MDENRRNIETKLKELLEMASVEGFGIENQIPYITLRDVGTHDYKIYIEAEAWWSNDSDRIFSLENFFRGAIRVNMTQLLDLHINFTNDLTLKFESGEVLIIKGSTDEGSVFECWTIRHGSDPYESHYLLIAATNGGDIAAWYN